jgi:hypothetical protein
MGISAGSLGLMAHNTVLDCCCSTTCGAHYFHWLLASLHVSSACQMTMVPKGGSTKLGGLVAATHQKRSLSLEPNLNAQVGYQ